MAEYLMLSEHDDYLLSMVSRISRSVPESELKACFEGLKVERQHNSSLGSRSNTLFREAELCLLLCLCCMLLYD
jgi:hypothetical protein